MRVFTTETQFWAKQLLGGGAFAARAVSGAVAAKFSACQLFNPAGSGKVLLLRWILIDGIAGGQAVFQSNQAGALATLSGNGSNLRTGGALSTGTLQTDQLGAGPPGTNAEVMTGMTFPSLYGPDFLSSITPGNGTVFTMSTANTALGVTFYWIEG